MQGCLATSASPQLSLLNVGPLGTHCFQHCPLRGNSKGIEKPQQQPFSLHCIFAFLSSLAPKKLTELFSSHNAGTKLSDDYIFPWKMLDLL